MYTFNDFQGETFAKRIYDSAKSNITPIAMGISAGINSEYEANYGSQSNDKFSKFAKLFIASGGVVSLASIIVNGANFNTVAALVLSGAAIATEFIAIPIIHLVNKAQYVSGRLDEEYNTLMIALHYLSEENFTKEITDEEIHEMTESLQNGELEEKSEFLSTMGKCPIILWEVNGKNHGSKVYFPIANLDLERAYEVMMHVASNAEEGYEEYIKEGYRLIKNYVSIMENSESTKEDMQKAIDDIHDLETRIAHKGRK